MAALVELATQRDLDEISVGELATAAGVNRATFYLHYADKEALLLDAIGAVTDEISAGAGAASGAELVDGDRAPRHTLAFFVELERHAALYRRVLGPGGSPAVAAHLRDGMQRAITEEIDHRSPDRRLDDRSTARVSAFVAGGVLAAAIRWLDDDQRLSAADEAAAVWRMVLDASMPLWGRSTSSEPEPGLAAGPLDHVSSLT